MAAGRKIKSRLNIEMDIRSFETITRRNERTRFQIVRAGSYFSFHCKNLIEVPFIQIARYINRGDTFCDTLRGYCTPLSSTSGYRKMQFKILSPKVVLTPSIYSAHAHAAKPILSQSKSWDRSKSTELPVHQRFNTLYT